MKQVDLFVTGKCEHPDPKTVRWLFCRRCGYFMEGERIGEATDGVLKEVLSRAKEEDDRALDDICRHAIGENIAKARTRR